MIIATSDANSPPNQSITVSSLGRDQKLEKKVQPSHYVGGSEAGGSEATSAATSTSKEAAEADTADCP